MKTHLSHVALIAILLPGLGAAHPMAAGPNLAGTWQFSVDLDEGSHGDPIFVFKQEGDKLTGTYDGPMGHQEVARTVTGNKAVFGFQTSQDGETVKATYTATIESENKMSGTVEFSGDFKGKWTAVRK
jgi:hypothetical protein